MDRIGLQEWLSGYERAWRAPGTEALAELFADGATYRMAPYRDDHVGLPAIAELWDRQRDGPDEPFEMTTDVVAVEGDTGVARIEVSYEDPVQEWRELWVVRFDEDGRCVKFEEWPIAPPGQEDSGGA